MKHTRRILSVFLAVLMVVVVLPVVFGVEIVESGTCGQDGDNVTWKLDSEGTLTISGLGAMKDYNDNIIEGTESPFSQNPRIISVIINDGVTRIGDKTFPLCENLRNVSIPDSVKSIGAYAFERCCLWDLYIPDSVKSIGQNAFALCAGPTTILVDADNPVFASDDNGCLYNKDKTTLIRYPAGNERSSFSVPETVTSIESHAFSNCKDLITVTIPDNVVSIGCYAFGECSFLTNVSIGQNVQSIEDYTFCHCDSLTSLSIPHNVTAIGDYAFIYCNQLTNVTIPNRVTSIGNAAFQNCYSLTSVMIPDSVTHIGFDAFYLCNNLTDVYYTGSEEEWNRIDMTIYGIDLPEEVVIHFNYNPPIETSGQCGNDVYWSFDAFSKTLKISGMGSMWDFDEVPQPWSAFQDDLETVILEDGVTSIGKTAFLDCCQLTSVTIPDSVTSIGGWAFHHCRLLRHLFIPANVTNIGLYVFDGCYNLQSISVDSGNPAFASDDSGCLYNKNKTVLIQYPIGNWRTSFSIPESVTHIGENAFYQCFFLEDVQIPNSVTTIGDGAFFICYNLETVTIPDSVTSIGAYAFVFTGATQFTVDANNPAYVSDESGCLYNKDKTVLIQYPIENERTSFSIPDSVVTIGIAAFSYCNNLIDVTIPNSVTVIETEAFRQCNGLTVITVPDSVMNIGNNAFGFCENLTDVTISNSVTDIGDLAFVDCNRLTRVTIGNGVARIGWSAFNDCSSLTDVYYTGSEDEWNLIETEPLNDPLLNATKHYISADFFVAAVAGEGGSVNGGGTYEKGEQVSLTAVPDTGYHFVGWLDGEETISSNLTYAFTVSGDVTLTAQFVPHQYIETVTQDASCETDGIRIMRCACGDSYTETLPAPGHIDEDNDGVCDVCENKMTGSDHCPRCGRIHNGGFFDGITGFFHRLIYRLTHLFG